MSNRERATALIIKLMDVKNPLSEERQPLWDDLKVLLADVAGKEQELRQNIKAIQDKIAPLDILMADIDRAGNFKSQTGARMLLDELEVQANGFTN